MSLFQFRTPAGIQDFAGDTAKQDQLNELWSNNLNGFIQQAMMGNPWNATNVPAATNYYNPIDANPASSAVAIVWQAFPNRVAFNFPHQTQDQLNELADTGQMPGKISDNPCSTDGNLIPYFPYGPRGWQDEYCEWAVTRNDNGKITRIDFTCENPEYWNSVWRIDPATVLTLYQNILNKPQITLEDLSAPGITDPITKGPVYNPLNKWNSGTMSDDVQGGAIHLTSTPNTIQTEMGLASSSTVLRAIPNSQPPGTNWPTTQYNALLCDAQYGQKERHSDPTIGGNVNNLVSENNVVATLTDPPGLYIQYPVFEGVYITPDGTDASKFWTILRGSESLNSQDGTPLPGNFILHAVFEVPASYGYTVSDIQINGANINWGSQVANTFNMHIVASAYPGTTTPPAYEAVGSPSTPSAQPLQLFYADYFIAMYGTMVPNPVNNPIPLLSNSTYVAPQIQQGTPNAQMVVVCDTCTANPNDKSTFPTVSFSDSNITVTVNKVMNDITYAIPGNSKPSTYTALFITVDVGSNASLGYPQLYITNQGQEQNQPMPALLNVI